MLFEKFTSLFSRFNLKLINQIYHKVLPPICILCGAFIQGAHNLCTECHKNLPILTQKCDKCAQFLPFIQDSFLCGKCLQNPPPFLLTHALFSYQHPITYLILGLKFKRQLCFARALGELLAEKIQREWYAFKSLPELIIPIPLHPKRLQERGFNQALEIARPIAKILAIPIDSNGANRIKHTAPQSNLSASERKHNIANAFRVTRDYSNLSVAVLDDVITTGHTINEFCKALKRKGAKNIHVWCCARR